MMGIGFNTICSWLLKKRWNKIKAKQFSPLVAQRESFLRLKKFLKGTTISQRAGLEDSVSLDDFIQNGRASDYSSISDLVDKHLAGKAQSGLFHDDFSFVGLSSGTTGKNSKKILFNTGTLKTFKSFQLDVAAILQQHSSFRILQDQRLTWGSSAEVSKSEKGIPEGYVSGFLSMNSPKLLEKKTFPSKATALKLDMNEKISSVAAEVRNADLRLISGVPTYLINLLEALKIQYGVKNFSEIWPNLETVIYSATGIEPYRKQIEELIGRPLKFIGIYASTEGPIGYEIPSLTGQGSGTYAFHMGEIVYSFRKLAKDKQVGEGRLLSVGDLQVGDEVELFVSTLSGLLNYSMGDCLRIKSVSPMITFEIMGRVGQGLNVATEKVSLSELQRAALQAHSDIRHFMVYPSQAPSGRPCYEWTLFMDQPSVESQEKMAEKLDLALMKQNGDYEEARTETLFLDQPKVRLVSSDLLKIYFERESHRGQLKMKSAFDSKDKAEEFLKGIYSAAGQDLEAVA